MIQKTLTRRLADAISPVTKVLSQFAANSPSSSADSTSSTCLPEQTSPGAKSTSETLAENGTRTSGVSTASQTRPWTFSDKLPEVSSQHRRGATVVVSLRDG